MLSDHAENIRTMKKGLRGTAERRVSSQSILSITDELDKSKAINNCSTMSQVPRVRTTRPKKMKPQQFKRILREVLAMRHVLAYMISSTPDLVSSGPTM